MITIAETFGIIQKLLVQGFKTNTHNLRFPEVQRSVLLLIFLLGASLDNPFRGEISVSPHPSNSFTGAGEVNTKGQERSLVRAATEREPLVERYAFSWDSFCS